MKSFGRRDQITSYFFLDKKKNESKCSQNDESSQERNGKKQKREEHERESQKNLTNQIPEDTRRLGPPFPTKIIGLITPGY